MKNRKGFVSNSSSSSFIIACSKNMKITELRGKIMINVNVGQYVNDDDDDINVIDSYKSLQKYILSEFNWNNRNEITVFNEFIALHDNANALHLYTKYSKYLEENKKIIIGTTSDQNGDKVESIICRNGIDSLEEVNFDIIDGEGGY